MVSTGLAIIREQRLDLHDGEINVVYGSLARWPWRENSNVARFRGTPVDFLKATGKLGKSPPRSNWLARDISSFLRVFANENNRACDITTKRESNKKIMGQ